MAIKWLGWLGMSTPEKRAKSEVEDLDRQIYDAEKMLHSARATLAYLSQRRDFLIHQFDFQCPPSSPANLAALAPPVRRVTRCPKKPHLSQSVQTVPLLHQTDPDLQTAYDNMVRARDKKQY